MTVFRYNADENTDRFGIQGAFPKRVLAVTARYGRNGFLWIGGPNDPAYPVDNEKTLPRRGTKLSGEGVEELIVVLQYLLNKKKI